VQEALRADADCAARLSGLTMRVHCARHAPVRDYHWVDFDTAEDHHISTRKWAEVSATGEVEVVAHATGVAERLRSLDLGRARQLSAVQSFWRARQDTLARASAEVCAPLATWCTSRSCIRCTASCPPMLCGHRAHHNGITVPCHTPTTADKLLRACAHVTACMHGAHSAVPTADQHQLLLLLYDPMTHAHRVLVARALTGCVAPCMQALRVKFVWPDENCSSRDFCLWAGRVLRDKLLRHELSEAQFSFNLLVHSDDHAPAASFLPSSSTVQVSLRTHMHAPHACAMHVCPVRAALSGFKTRCAVNRAASAALSSWSCCRGVLKPSQTHRLEEQGIVLARTLLVVRTVHASLSRRCW
jgi:hypothetical protein